MCYKKFSSSYSIAAPSISMCTQLYIDSYPKSLAHIRKDNSLMNTIFFWITTNNIYPQTGIVQHFTSCILWFKIHSKLKFKNIWNNTALVYTFKFSHFKKNERYQMYIGTRGPMGTSKHQRLLPRVLATLHNLMARPYCWRQYFLMSLNTEKSIWCLSRSFSPTDQHLW